MFQHGIYRDYCRTNKRRLHTFITNISSIVQNRDDLGFLLGYTFVGSQLNHIPEQSSFDKINRGEVTRYYDGLVTVKNMLDVSRTDDTDVIITDIREQVDAYMDASQESMIVIVFYYKD